MLHEDPAGEVATNIAERSSAMEKRFLELEALGGSHRLETGLRIFDLTLTIIKVGIMLWVALPHAA